MTIAISHFKEIEECGCVYHRVFEDATNMADKGVIVYDALCETHNNEVFSVSKQKESNGN